MLRAERKKLGLSRERLAARIGTEVISGSTIKRVETGAENVSEEAIEIVASAFGMTYDRKDKFLKSRPIVEGESSTDTLQRIAHELLILAAKISTSDENDGVGAFGDDDVLGHHAAPNAADSARRPTEHGKANSRAHGRASRRKPR